MNIEECSYAVYLPEKLQEKMEADPEFAKEINAKLEDFFNSAKKESGTLDDGTEYSVISHKWLFQWMKMEILYILMSEQKVTV